MLEVLNDRRLFFCLVTIFPIFERFLYYSHILSQSACIFRVALNTFYWKEKTYVFEYSIRECFLIQFLAFKCTCSVPV